MHNIAYRCVNMVCSSPVVNADHAIRQNLMEVLILKFRHIYTLFLYWICVGCRTLLQPIYIRNKVCDFKAFFFCNYKIRIISISDCVDITHEAPTDLFLPPICRRRVVQVFERGARILDGSYMTQELSLVASNTDSASSTDCPVVSSVSIADPYVLLRMTDGTIRLLIGGTFS